MAPSRSQLTNMDPMTAAKKERDPSSNINGFPSINKKETENSFLVMKRKNRCGMC